MANKIKNEKRRSRGENSRKELDRQLAILREVMEKENEMLRKMISSLDSLEKKITQSKKRR